MGVLIIIVISFLLPFGITALCLKFYGNDFYVKWGIFKQMLFLNIFTWFTLFFEILIISSLISIIQIDDSRLLESSSFIFIVSSIFLFFEIICYWCFWKETHYKCPNCGSRHTLKLDDSDGEYTPMSFKCRKCCKFFTIPNRSIGGWPD